jgi:hypothetical protein
MLFFRSSIAAPQITSLRATLLPSLTSRRTSFHAACAPRLTALCASLHLGLPAKRSWLSGLRRERRDGSADL